MFWRAGPRFASWDWREGTWFISCDLKYIGNPKSQRQRGHNDLDMICTYHAMLLAIRNRSSSMHLKLIDFWFKTSDPIPVGHPKEAHELLATGYEDTPCNAMFWTMPAPASHLQWRA